MAEEKQTQSTKDKGQISKFKEQLSKKSFDYPEPQGMQAQARPLGAQPVEPKPAPKKETKE